MTAGSALHRPLTTPRALGWAAFFLVGGFALTLVFATIGAALTGGLHPADSARLILLQSVSGLLAYGLMTWAIGLRILKLTLGDLRYLPLAGAGRGFGLGFLLGGSPAALAITLSLVLGGARFLPDSGGGGEYVRRVVLTTLLLAPAALLEEVMFRGVSQVVLAPVLGRVRAILLLSVIFALAHVFNPNGTTLGLLNIGLAGLFLGLAFYAPGGLWTVWGAHLGWNATLAALDAPVSGLPFPIPLIDYAPGGPTWLTGGSFGPEGGVVATAAIGLGAAAAWRWSRKEQVA